MKLLFSKIRQLSVTAQLSLIVSALLVIAIGVTINNALTRQEEIIHAEYLDPAEDSSSVSCSPRPLCLDESPSCDMPEPENGWCLEKSTLGVNQTFTVPTVSYCLGSCPPTTPEKNSPPPPGGDTIPEPTEESDPQITGEPGTTTPSVTSIPTIEIPEESNSQIEGLINEINKLIEEIKKLLSGDNSDPGANPGGGISSCPSVNADYKVSFGNKTLRANRSAADARTSPVSISIPPGKYHVMLGIYDDHAGKPGQNQPDERFFVEFGNSSKKVVATTKPINDLKDAEDCLKQEVDTQLNISEKVDFAVAVHHAYPSNNVNSLIPNFVALSKTGFTDSDTDANLIEQLIKIIEELVKEIEEILANMSNSTSASLENLKGWLDDLINNLR
jgi:ElaB/YqjD/DUF883 family membrane-anchored ribosome-binding protein